ncbi:MAG TPA: HU family DNA-binding protein [Opitutae bacterium]|nr:HU family DNA-binding protein [Opitutae bacterium]
MNKAELINEIQKEVSKGGNEVSKACIERFLGATLNAIMKGTKKDGSVQLIGFGTFKTKQLKARNGVNPQTGKPLHIPARKSVGFSASSVFKDLCKK